MDVVFTAPREQLLEQLRATVEPTLIAGGRPETRPASIGLLSGSFDPMTVAHAALAEAASNLVDHVLLVYSVRTLPKERHAPPPLLAEPDRLDVLERFCERTDSTEVALCSHGLLADQVAAARKTFRGQLRLVIGSDKALQLLDRKWYEDRDAVLDALFQEASVLYADRAGEEGAVVALLARPENRRWRERFTRLDVPPEVAAISSRLVRTLIGEGRDARQLFVEEAKSFLLRRGAPHE